MSEKLKASEIAQALVRAQAHSSKPIFQIRTEDGKGAISVIKLGPSAFRVVVQDDDGTSQSSHGSSVSAAKAVVEAAND
jgi:hypothetical protein